MKHVRVRCMGCGGWFDSPKFILRDYGQGHERKEHRCPECGAATPKEFVKALGITEQ